MPINLFLTTCRSRSSLWVFGVRLSTIPFFPLKSEQMRPRTRTTSSAYKQQRLGLRFVFLQRQRVRPLHMWLCWVLCHILVYMFLCRHHIFVHFRTGIKCTFQGAILERPTTRPGRFREGPFPGRNSQHLEHRAPSYPRDSDDILGGELTWCYHDLTFEATCSIVHFSAPGAEDGISTVQWSAIALPKSELFSGVIKRWHIRTRLRRHRVGLWANVMLRAFHTWDRSFSTLPKPYRWSVNTLLCTRFI